MKFSIYLNRRVLVMKRQSMLSGNNKEILRIDTCRNFHQACKRLGNTLLSPCVLFVIHSVKLYKSYLMLPSLIKGLNSPEMTDSMKN